MFFKKTKVAAVATTEAASIQTATPRTSKRQKGFTLLELGFVVGLISIIVGGFAVYQNTDNAKATRAYADMTTVKESVLRFQADAGINPRKISHLWAGMDPFEYGGVQSAKWGGPYMNQRTIWNPEGNEEIQMFKLGGGSRLSLVAYSGSLDEFGASTYEETNEFENSAVPLGLVVTHVSENVARLILAKCGYPQSDISESADAMMSPVSKGQVGCAVQAREFGGQYDVYMNINPAI